MKNTTQLAALTILLSIFTACGESTTDEPLPEGTVPNDPPAEREVDPAPQPEPEAPDPTPAVNEPEVRPLPPLPLPVPEGDAERSKAPGISYVLPEGWAVGPKKQMRLLTLLPPDAQGVELAIAKWPGDVGGFASNVQRWVAQAGLPPIPGLMTAAASDFEKFSVGGTTATWIPLMNEDRNTAILAVWVPRGDTPENPTETWTFKMQCKADQVATLAPAMRAFCESVKFED